MSPTVGRLFWGLVGASCLCLVLNFIGLFYWPRFVATTVSAPIEHFLYSTKQLGLESVSFLTFWRSGEARIKNLEQRNWQLVAATARLSDLEKENQALREQLGVQIRKGQDSLVASVLGGTNGLLIYLLN